MNKITIDCIIGIDPGKTGGIAVWRPNRGNKNAGRPYGVAAMV